MLEIKLLEAPNGIIGSERAAGVCTSALAARCQCFLRAPPSDDHLAAPMTELERSPSHEHRSRDHAQHS